MTETEKLKKEIQELDLLLEYDSWDRDAIKKRMDENKAKLVAKEQQLWSMMN